MAKKAKPQILHPGGIALVSTPSLEYMAKTAYKELQRCAKKRYLDFHVVKYQKFSREEILPQIQKNVRLRSVYLFYDFNGDTCHDAFVLQLTVSALQDAGAQSITLMMPYMPFLRQDRKDRSRVPISARDFIHGYERYEKVERTITVDMHADQTQGVFDKRSDHLPGHVIFVPWIKQHFGNCLEQVVIVGPDAGSEKRVKGIAKRVGCERAFFTKERNGSSIEVQEHHGASVKDKICVLNDDIIDSGNTIIKAADALMQLGAQKVYITGTHAVFGKGIYKRLAQVGYPVVVTDSLHVKAKPYINVLPLGRLMGHAILQNVIENGSVSTIIENGLPK